MGSLSSFALGIVSAAILSRYFDKDEYGTYRQILYVYNTLLIVFSAGLPKVYGYFLPRFSLEEGKSIIKKVSTLLLIFGLFFSVSLYIFSGLIATLLKNPELEVGLKYFSPVPLLLLPTLGLEGIFSTYKKTVYLAIYNTLTRLLMLIFIITPVIYFKGGYLEAIYGWIAVSIISFFLAQYFINIPFKNVAHKKASFSIKSVFDYSLPLVAASISGIAIKAADQFYISRYFGSEAFAEYANGFIQLPFISMITSATSVVLMPAFSKMIHEKTEIENVVKLWKNTLEKSAVLTYPLVIFFIFNAAPIVILLYSETYFNSVVYFQIAMILNFFNIIVFAPLLFSMGETKFYFRIHFFFAIWSWLGAYALIQIFFNPVAIALFSVLNSILLVILCVLKSSKLLKVGFLSLFPISKILKISLHSSIVLIIISQVLSYANIDNKVFLLAVSGISFLLLLLLTSGFFKIDYLESFKIILFKVKKNA